MIHFANKDSKFFLLGTVYTGLRGGGNTNSASTCKEISFSRNCSSCKGKQESENFKDIARKHL